jgi:hypothetical protein
MPSPSFDTTTVPGVRILDGTSEGRDIDAGFEALAVDLTGLDGSFSASRGAGVSLADGAVVVFDSEAWDTEGWFDVATGRFTPQEPGVYRLGAGVAPVSAITAENYWGVDIRKNGSGHRTDYRIQRGTVVPTPHASLLVAANGSTDYFDVMVEHNQGGSVAIQTSIAMTYFQGELVGRQ